MTPIGAIACSRCGLVQRPKRNGCWRCGSLTVDVPRDLLIRALTKARLLYVASCEADRQDPGDDDECWAEFEALAEFVGSIPGAHGAWLPAATEDIDPPTPFEEVT